MTKIQPGSEALAQHAKHIDRRKTVNIANRIGLVAGIGTVFATVVGIFVSFQPVSAETDYPGISDRVAARAEKELHQTFDIRCEHMPDKYLTGGPTSGRVGLFNEVLQQTIFLDTELCKDIDNWEDLPQYSREHAIELIAVSHEAWHTMGVKDEAAAQCYALQSTVSELSKNTDVTSLELIASSVKNMSESLPHKYQSPDCRTGGKLDLGLLNGGIWLED